MAAIPSYFSGSNPYLSNLRLAALSTCDLNRSKFSINVNPTTLTGAAALPVQCRGRLVRRGDDAAVVFRQ